MNFLSFIRLMRRILLYFVLVILALIIIFLSFSSCNVRAASDVIMFNMWGDNNIKVFYHNQDSTIWGSMASTYNTNIYNDTNNYTFVENKDVLSASADNPYMVAIQFYSQNVAPNFTVGTLTGAKAVFRITCNFLITDNQFADYVWYKGGSFVRFFTNATQTNYIEATCIDYTPYPVTNPSGYSVSSCDYFFELDLTDVPMSTSFYGFSVKLPFHTRCVFDGPQTLNPRFNFHVQGYLYDVAVSSDLTTDELKDIVSGSTQDIIDNQNQNTQDIIDNQNQNTDKIIDSFQQSQENEKAEASDTGNKQVDKLLEAIPDFSGNWTSGLSSFAEAFSYEGTDFQLTWPAYSIPSLNIGGVETGSMRLWDDYTIDIENIVITTIPPVLLSTVQIVLTIALALFCVLEIMDLILSVMTAFSVRIRS